MLHDGDSNPIETTDTKDRRMKKLIVPIDIYRRGVCFLCGDTDELTEYFASEKLYSLVGRVSETDWNTTLAFTLCDGNDVWVCSNRPMTIPVLCHEITHAVFKILEIIGADSPINEETYAYLCEYLMGEVTSSSSGFPLQLSSDAS